MNTNINPRLLSRLAAKKQNHPSYSALAYRNPMIPHGVGAWGGTTFKCGENVGYHHTFARWHETPWEAFRFVGIAHDVVKLRHTGWYTRHEDQCSSELARGVVYQASHGRFLAGVADPYNSAKDGTGPCIFEVNEKGSPCIYESKEEAARGADSLAEIYAESCREDDRVQSAIIQCEERKSEAEKELDESRHEARSLLAEIRQSQLSPGLCEHMKRSIRALRRKMHSAYAEIASTKKELSTLNA